MGIAVIPIQRTSKKPRIAWMEYQKRLPSSEELKRWFDVADPPNIAIVCGAVSGNLVVLDFDDEVLYRKFWFHESALRNATVLVKSARPGRYHVWLRSDESFKKFKPVDRLDVQAEGSYVLAPPSVTPQGSYEFINDITSTSIAVVPHLQLHIYEKLRAVGITAWERRKPIHQILKGGLSEGEGRHPDAIRLAAYLVHVPKLDDAGVLTELERWNSLQKTPLSDDDLRRIHATACGYRESDAKAEKEQFEGIYTPFVEGENGLLAEQVYDEENGSRYILYDNISGKTSYAREFSLKGVLYHPINNNHPKNRQVLLPSGAEEYDTTSKLINEVKNFLDKYHEEPNRLERRIDVLYIFETWVAFGRDCLGMIPQMPYRRRRGQWGYGKTRALETLGAVCYRPFYIAGCGSEAALRRRFDLWRGTAIMDEADFSSSDLYATIVKILEAGWDKDKAWYDMQDTIDPSKGVSLYVYGPKVASTREDYADRALEARFLTADAAEKTKPMPISLTDAFFVEALRLRNKLLLWRFRHYFKVKKALERLSDPGLEAELYGNLQVSGRIKQVFAPLFLIAPDDFKATLLAAAQIKDAALKTGDLDQQIAIQVEDTLRQMLRIFEDKEVTIVTMITQTMKGAYRTLGEEYIVMPLADIAGRITGDALDRWQNREMARAIRNILHFTIQAGAGNRKNVYVPFSFLARLYPDNKSLNDLFSPKSERW